MKDEKKAKEGDKEEKSGHTMDTMGAEYPLDDASSLIQRGRMKLNEGSQRTG